MFAYKSFNVGKRSVLCLGAFPLDKHLEICLQKGSVFHIWRRASNLSAVKG